MTKNIYDAIDTDNAGTLEVNQVEIFVRSFLKGNQIEGQINTSFEEKHDEIFKLLQDNESGELTLDELGKWLNENKNDVWWVNEFSYKIPNGYCKTRLLRQSCLEDYGG